MKRRPPRWADHFLQWYCVPEKLEEIQGDVYELFSRRAVDHPIRAQLLFYWDVIRFFRNKNTRVGRKIKSITAEAMIRNIVLVAYRNFKRQAGVTMMNIGGLAVGFTCGILILLWMLQEFRFDRFAAENEKVFRILSHVKTENGIQTYDLSSSGMDVSTVPEILHHAVVSTGERWPHELCFRPDENPNTCVYLKGVYAKESFFQVLHYPILYGPSSPAIKPNEIVLSQKMANALFGKNDVVGRTMKIDGRHEVTVVAVMKNVPVTSTLQFDFVMPFNILGLEWGVPESQLDKNFFHVFVSTAREVSPAFLTEKLSRPPVLSKDLIAEHVSYEAFPYTQWHLNSKFENGKPAGGRMEYVILFCGIAVLIVLLAIINFINMTTSRASTRAKEIGVRKVTGASRSGIMVQFLGESFLTVVAAFVLAMLLTYGSLPFFNQMLPEPVEIGQLGAVVILPIVFLIIAVAALAGLYPAFVMSSFQPVSILKDKITGTLTGSHRLRKTLLLVQLSIALCIVIFSGVIYLQLSYIASKDIGFDRQNLIRMEPTYNLLQKFNVFKEKMLGSEDILSITAANLNPLNVGGGNFAVEWPGKSRDMKQGFSILATTWEFPETFAIQLKEGRNFSTQERDSVNSEVLLSEDAAAYMNLKNPVGEHISIHGVSCVIVGIVKNFHTGSLRQSRMPVIIQQVPIFNTGNVFIRYAPGRANEAVRQLQKVYDELQPDYTIKFSFLDDSFNELYKTEQTASHLSVVMTIITLIIALIGVAGLAAFNVYRRTREIGVRRVFGATRVQILAMLSGELAWVMAGAAIALPVTFFLSTQWLSGFAYHVDTPWGWYIVSFLLIVIITLTVLVVNALRTIATNPSDALRSE